MEPTVRHTVRASRRLTPVLVAIGLSVAAAPSVSGAQAGVKGDQTILFMCPHGAAKSVLASRYFKHLATERGLNVEVISAGTDPDAEVSPVVARHLEQAGYGLPTTKPRRATADDMASADVVVSIGCDLKDLPAPRGKVVKWDDVPPPSEDFKRADEKIRQRVLDLVDELVRQQRKQQP